MKILEKYEKFKKEVFKGYEKFNDEALERLDTAFNEVLKELPKSKLSILMILTIVVDEEEFGLSDSVDNFINITKEFGIDGQDIICYLTVKEFEGKF